MHFQIESVDLGRMRGCHRKLWENVMKVIVMIEKTNTMTNCSVCDPFAHAPLKELTRECMMPSQKYTSSQQCVNGIFGDFVK